jgi:hypothetical protein
MGFVSEHPRLGPAALLALLSAYLLDSGYLRRHLPGLFPFNFVEQYPPGNKPIESLLTSCLALHLQAGWPVEQHYARRRFIDVLTPMTSRSHKSFFDIGLANPQGSHPLGKLLWIFWIDGKRGHCRSLVEQIEIHKEGHPPRPHQAPNYPGRLAKNLCSFRPFAIIKHPCALSFNG